MKRSTIIGIAIVVVAVTFATYASATYNTLVPLQEAISKKEADVQVALQSQADLLLNLVNAVSGNVRFEKSTQAEVAAARSGLEAVSRVDPTTIANNPDLQRQVIEAQARIGAAQTKVVAAMEATPELKSTPLFGTLMAQIEGAQNRVTYTRREQQKAYVDYNTTVRRFPRSLVAGMMGFRPRQYYQADASAQHTRIQVPE